MRYFLRLSYKGTGYSGWQIQENAITVQEVLNDRLSKLLKGIIETTGCGRTDAGVHANQFFAHFDSDQPIPDEKKFLYSLNATLPSDIAVFDLIEVDPGSHSRFDATSRSYKYFISKHKNPFLNEYVWFNNFKYNLDDMNRACNLLKDHKDFSSFSKSNTQVKTNNCEINSAKWEVTGDLLVFSITADRFLRGMVRAIVGTILDIGSGKINVNDINEIIRLKDRSVAGTSVPACGLFLTSVKYPYISSVDEQNFSIPL